MVIFYVNGGETLLWNSLCGRHYFSPKETVWGIGRLYVINGEILMQLGRLCSDIESTRRHSLFKSKGDYFGGQTLYHDTGRYRRWFFSRRYCSNILQKVIVTPAVYPGLFEFLHFEILCQVTRHLWNLLTGGAEVVLQPRKASTTLCSPSGLRCPFPFRLLGWALAFPCGGAQVPVLRPEHTGTAPSEPLLALQVAAVTPSSSNMVIPANLPHMELQHENPKCAS